MSPIMRVRDRCCSSIRAMACCWFPNESVKVRIASLSRSARGDSGGVEPGDEAGEPPGLEVGDQEPSWISPTAHHRMATQQK
eukprot:15167160-Heterocapsa_arctica.AAC.1